MARMRHYLPVVATIGGGSALWIAAAVAAPPGRIAFAALVEGALIMALVALCQVLRLRGIERLAALEAALATAERIVADSPAVLCRLGAEETLPLLSITPNIARHGYSGEELLASPRRWLGLVHPDDSRELAGGIAGLLSGDAEPFRCEIRWKRSDGSYVWFETSWRVLGNAAQRPAVIEGMLRDVSERKAAGERIAELARTDALTELPNRAAFVDRLAAAFSALKRGAAPFAVIFLDLDNFKDVNDVLGHSTGERLLQAAAERLKECVRAADLVARLGGDEFAVLQTDVRDGLAAATMARRIIESLAAPYTIGANEVHVTASAGISLHSEGAAGPEAMMRQADLALHRAKQEGRNRFCFHAADFDAEVHERVKLADALRNALKLGQFELHYQPQVDLRSQRITGLEALIRWNHPTRGLVSPVLFIPIAERTGLILPLGRWVVEEACRQLRQWRDAGIETPTLAVNASALQFRGTTDFESELVDSMARWGVAPDELEIELTESVLMEHSEERDNPIERLRRLGTRIAIDDFGTGYSSLAYLSIYPITRLKIAQELVSRSLVDARNTAIVRAAIGLARELGVDVIAEGVETEAQLKFLAEAGCTNVQGYFYSTPIRAGAMTEMLRRGTIETESGRHRLVPAAHPAGEITSS